jgi:hypothetical protein
MMAATARNDSGKFARAIWQSWFFFPLGEKFPLTPQAEETFTD